MKPKSGILGSSLSREKTTVSEENPSQEATPISPGDGDPTEVVETPPKNIQRDRKRRWRKWILLAALALCCCCGGPIVSVPITLFRAGAEFTRIHQSLSPGMSTSELLGQVNTFKSSRFGLSRMFLYPQDGSKGGGALEPPVRACPAQTAWVWGLGQGAPWGRGNNPTLESAAMALANCEEVEFVGVVLSARLHFTVTLSEGKIATIGPTSMDP